MKLQLEQETKLGRLNFYWHDSQGPGFTYFSILTLYSDIQPFFPLTSNPLYRIASSTVIYTQSVWLGIAGIIGFLSLFFIFQFNSSKN